MPNRTPLDTASGARKLCPKPQVRRMEPIAAAQAKAHLLRLIDEVSRDGIPVIITKRGKPLVQLAPLAQAGELVDIVGCMKGTFTITGDIVGPEPDEWEAMQ